MYRPAKPYKHKIIEEIRRTWKTPYLKVRFDTYPIFESKISLPEVDHTDGIGTKGLYHWKAGTMQEAVLDAFAMNLNDLAIVRAKPYKLSNHITLPKEDNRILEILSAMAKECVARKIAIVGGENSFHDNMEGMDISMTISGFIKKSVPNKFRIGDMLIALKSSGLHSNGFTKVRKVFGTATRKEFTTPTTIYLDTILELIETHTVHGMMHITGGAFSKLKDVLGNADAHIEQPKKLLPQKIFYELYSRGVSNRDMYTTFNCGVGFVISVPKNEAEKIVSKTPNAAIIGKVEKGRGNVHIKSAFDGKMISL